MIEAVARVAAELGVSSAEVALARVRNRPAITSTLIGARTLEQLRSNLASLEVTLATSVVMPSAVRAPSSARPVEVAGRAVACSLPDVATSGRVCARLRSC